MDTVDSEHFSPYRADGKLYGFVCVVTGAQQPVGQAIIQELAGMSFVLYVSPLSGDSWVEPWIYKWLRCQLVSQKYAEALCTVLV